MDIRFMHIADVHLGARPRVGRAVADRAAELWEALTYGLSVCREEKIPLLLIAGDVFHYQPQPEQTSRLARLFGGFPEVEIVWIAGNHDHVHPASAYLFTQWPENVHPLLEERIESVTLFDGLVTVYGMSYDKKEVYEPLYDSLRAEHKSPVEILLAHGGDASHSPLSSAALAESGFTYVALGHIHKPMTILPGKAEYPGALSPIDVGDTGPHGCIIGTVQGGVCRIERRPFPMRMYKEIFVTLDENIEARSIREQVTEAIRGGGKRHMYIVRFQGERPFHLDLSGEPLRQYIDAYGAVVDVRDETKQHLDPALLRKKYPGSLLDHFIGYMERSHAPKEALEIGMTAILEQMQEQDREIDRI